MKNETSDLLLSALMDLTERGVPVDMQETLLYGSVSLGVAPGGLKAVLEDARDRALEEAAALVDNMRAGPLYAHYDNIAATIRDAKSKGSG